MKAIYRNIRNRRKELKLTQAELAQRLGYADKSMIAKIEKGVINLPQDRIEAFARALGTTPVALAGWTEEKNDRKRPRCLEQLMDMIGWSIADDFGEMITLMRDGEKYEITESGMKELESRTAHYLDFLLNDLTKSSQKAKKQEILLPQ